MKNIYIVGFMGTGKTVVGRALARKLKAPFADLDSIIEEKEKMSIPQIFQDRGEAYFRSVEKRELLEVSSKQGSVVSCGGGIVLDAQNRDLIKNTGISVCLRAQANDILKRIGSTTHRPLLHGGDPLEKIQELLSDRDKYYSQADIAVDTSDLSIEEIAETIFQKLPSAGK
jgi:shikimate kinase